MSVYIPPLLAHSFPDSYILSDDLDLKTHVNNVIQSKPIWDGIELSIIPFFSIFQNKCFEQGIKIKTLSLEVGIDTEKVNDLYFHVEFEDERFDWNRVEHIFLACLAKQKGILYWNEGNRRVYNFAGEKKGIDKLPSWKNIPPILFEGKAYCGQIFKQQFAEAFSFQQISLPIQIEQNRCHFQVNFGAFEPENSLQSRVINLIPLLECTHQQAQLRVCSTGNYPIREVQKHFLEKQFICSENIKGDLKSFVYYLHRGYRPTRPQWEKEYVKKFKEEFKDTKTFEAELRKYFDGKHHFNKIEHRIHYLQKFERVLSEQNVTLSYENALGTLLVECLGITFSGKPETLFKAYTSDISNYFDWVKCYSALKIFYNPEQLAQRLLSIQQSHPIPNEYREEILEIAYTFLQTLIPTNRSLATELIKNFYALFTPNKQQILRDQFMALKGKSYEMGFVLYEKRMYQGDSELLRFILFHSHSESKQKFQKIIPLLTGGRDQIVILEFMENLREKKRYFECRQIYEKLKCDLAILPSYMKHYVFKQPKNVILSIYLEKEPLIVQLEYEAFIPILMKFIEHFASSNSETAKQILAKELPLVKEGEKRIIHALTPHVNSLKGCDRIRPLMARFSLLTPLEELEFLISDFSMNHAEKAFDLIDALPEEKRIYYWLEIASVLNDEVGFNLFIQRVKKPPAESDFYYLLFKIIWKKLQPSKELYLFMSAASLIVTVLQWKFDEKEILQKGLELIEKGISIIEADSDLHASHPASQKWRMALNHLDAFLELNESRSQLDPVPSFKETLVQLSALFTHLIHKFVSEMKNGEEVKKWVTRCNKTVTKLEDMNIIEKADSPNIMEKADPPNVIEIIRTGKKLTDMDVCYLIVDYINRIDLTSSKSESFLRNHFGKAAVSILDFCKSKQADYLKDLCDRVKLILVRLETVEEMHVFKRDFFRFYLHLLIISLQKDHDLGLIWEHEDIFQFLEKAVQLVFIKGDLPVEERGFAPKEVLKVLEGFFQFVPMNQSLFQILMTRLNSLMKKEWFTPEMQSVVHFFILKRIMEATDAQHAQTKIVSVSKPTTIVINNVRQLKLVQALRDKMQQRSPKTDQKNGLSKIENPCVFFVEKGFELFRTSAQIWEQRLTKSVKISDYTMSYVELYDMGYQLLKNGIQLKMNHESLTGFSECLANSSYWLGKMDGEKRKEVRAILGQFGINMDDILNRAQNYVIHNKLVLGNSNKNS